MGALLSMQQGRSLRETSGTTSDGAAAHMVLVGSRKVLVSKVFALPDTVM